MSESNNNIPMRITQLEEATAYEDGMVFAVSKAGSGTKKIDTSLKADQKSVSFNQWNEKSEIGGILANGLDNNYLTTSIRSKGFISVDESKKYYFYSETAKMWVFCYDENQDFLSSLNGGGAFKNEAFLLPTNTKYIRFALNNYGTTYNYDVCINIDQPDENITPHNGQYYKFSTIFSVFNDFLDYERNINNKMLELPFVGVSFSVPASTQHPSTSDEITLNLKAGEYLIAEAQGATSGIFILKFKDGTSRNVTYYGSRVKITLEKDIRAIGFWYNNTSENSVFIRVGIGVNPLAGALIENAEDKIILTKTSASEFNIKIPCKSGKVVRYNFRKDYKVWDSLQYTDAYGETQIATNVLSSNFWNNYYIYNDTDNTYMAQGHSNFIIKKDNHFSGDGHGNEIIITFDLLADGKSVDIDNLTLNQQLKCGELRLIVKSKMFKVAGNTGSDVPEQSYPALDTSGNPIVDFIHFMEISYNIGNVIKTTNKLIVQNNNTVFQSCFGAMLENNYGDFSKIIVNNAENTQNNLSDSGAFTVANGSSINLKDNKIFANAVEMFGKNHYIKQTMINNDLSKIGESAIYFGNYEGSRLKCYFVPVPTVELYPSGSTPETFNAGDIISVSNERIIEI